MFRKFAEYFVKRSGIHAHKFLAWSDAYESFGGISAYQRRQCAECGFIEQREIGTAVKKDGASVKHKHVEDESYR